MNLFDLSEKNYFPSDVLQGKESFITTSAKFHNDVLFLEGCFWADIDDVYLLFTDTYKTYSLRNILNIDKPEYEITIQDDKILLTDTDGKIENNLSFSLEGCILKAHMAAEIEI